MPSVDDVLRAIEADRPDVVRDAIAGGMDPNSIGTIEGAASLLTMACLMIRPGIARLLLDAGARPEGLDGMSRLPLECIVGERGERAKQLGCSLNEVEELILLLLARGARPATKNPGGGHAWLNAISSTHSLDVLMTWALEKSGGDQKKAAKLVGMTARQWQLLDKDRRAWIARGRPEE